MFAHQLTLPGPILQEGDILVFGDDTYTVSWSMGKYRIFVVIKAQEKRVYLCVALTLEPKILH